MSVKKYIIGLAATFAVGMGAGTYFGCKYSENIRYGLAKAERVMAAGEREYRKTAPESLQKVTSTMEIIRSGGKTKEEVEAAKEERISQLDKVIEEHESKE
ncbi:hypothetical protein KY310_00805 [Candidatus Woesearchaeota archaeon]|nr:hypothetical protein [Candidatus Woesearchaeota archaeon]